MPPIGPEDLTPVVPAIEPLLQFFDPAQYPGADVAIIQRYAQLADAIVMGIRPNPERSDALRKLMESMESTLRAQRYTHHGGPYR